MTERDEKELAIYRQIEQYIRESKETILMEIVPSNCGCKSQPTKLVFRCPQAFSINMCLEQLNQIRINK